MSYDTMRVPAVDQRREQLNYDGMPYFVSRPVQAQSSGATSTLVPVRQGVVRVVTDLLIRSTPDTETSPHVGNDEHLDFRLVDAAGTTRHTLSFLHFNHNLASGAGQANNDHFLRWRPRQPIVIPEGWSMVAVNPSTDAMQTELMGLVLDPHEARHRGHLCDTAATQANRAWINVGDKFASTGDVTLVTGKSGLHIELTDIVLRLQPETGTATVKLLDSTDVEIFRWHVSAITGDPVQHVLAPRIFLQAGRGLKINVSTNAQNRGSIVVLGRFVKDAPNDAFFSFVSPVRPTAGGLTQGNIFTLNYPNGDTQTAAQKNAQHVLEGFDISMGKDSTNPSTTVLAALLSGDTPSTLVPLVNTPLTPIFGMGSQSQQFNLSWDEVQIPAFPNQAVLWQTQAIVSTNADGDISDWGVTIWGRTRPTWKSATKSSHFYGT